MAKIALGSVRGAMFLNPLRISRTPGGSGGPGWEGCFSPTEMGEGVPICLSEEPIEGEPPEDRQVWRYWTCAVPRKVDGSDVTEGSVTLERVGDAVQLWTSREPGQGAAIFSGTGAVTLDLSDPADRQKAKNLWLETLPGDSSLNDVQIKAEYADSDGNRKGVVPTRIRVYSFGVVPTEDCDVTVDCGEIEIGGVVLTPSEDPDGSWESGADGSVIQWSIESGSGGSLSTEQGQTDDGCVWTMLTMPASPGHTFIVKAGLRSLKWRDTMLDLSGIEEMTGSLRTVAGRAHSIHIAQSKDSYSHNESESMTLTATIRDQYGNPVRDGPSVDWSLKGMGELGKEQTDSVTLNGQARATVRPGVLAQDQIVSVQCDEKTGSATIVVLDIQAALSSSKSSLDVHLEETAELNATFHDANGRPLADGTEVAWFASNGQIMGEAATTNGAAGAILYSAGARVASTLVGVCAANATSSARIDFTHSGPLRLELEHAAIAGDAMEDGVASYEQLDGSLREIAYHARANIEVYGPPEQTVTLSLSRGASRLVKLVGVDEYGRVNLNDIGRARVRLDSLGAQRADTLGEDIAVIASCNSEHSQRVRVSPKEKLGHLKNLAWTLSLGRGPGGRPVRRRLRGRRPVWLRGGAGHGRETGPPVARRR